MKWFDRFLASISGLLVLSTGADSLLNDLRPVPIIFASLLLVITGSFYYLKSAVAQDVEPQSTLIAPDGEPFAHRPSRKPLLVQLNRAAIVLASCGVVITLFFLRGSPSLTIEIDDVRNYSEVSGGKKVIYDVAGIVNGTKVYGRGQTLLVSLVNNSDNPVHISEIKVELVSYHPKYPANLRYDKIELKVPQTRLPVERVKTPIFWSLRDNPGDSQAIGEGRIRLSPTGSEADTHQLRFSVESRDPGLWEYRIVAEYNEPRKGGLSAIATNIQTFMILFRGL